MSNLLRLTESEVESIKNEFLEVAHLDNPSGKEELVIEWIQEWFQREGFEQAVVDDHRNMLLRIDGEGEWLLLNAHTDGVNTTIGKEPKFENGAFVTNGKTILSADDLGGVIAILYTMKLLKKHRVKHRPLEILLVSEEEVSGIGIKNFDKTQLKSKECILPDLVGPVGRVGVDAPSKWIFDITFHGIPAHVKNIDKGLSAIKVMAEFLHNLPIGQIDENTTLNIGTISGGKGVNVVPDRVDLSGNFKIYTTGEVRGFDGKQCAHVIDMIEKNIKALEANHTGLKADLNYRLVRQAYAIDTECDLLQNLKKVTESLGLEYEAVRTQGLSDGADLNGVGVKTAVIGVGYENAHTTKETMTLESLVTLTEQILNFCVVSK